MSNLCPTCKINEKSGHYAGYCRECNKKHSLEHYKNHKDYRLKKQREYYINNKEQILEYCRTHKEQDREACRRYYLKYQEREKERARRYSKSHPWTIKAWFSRNAKLRVVSATILKRVYRSNEKKYGTLTCEYCKNRLNYGQEAVDHKIPVSKGGSSLFRNLWISCIGCNRRKGTKSVIEFSRILKKEGEHEQRKLH